MTRRLSIALCLTAIWALSSCSPPDPQAAARQAAEAAEKQRQAQAAQLASDAQTAREANAEGAFAEIDRAQTNYPPLGADPTEYNRALSAAYHGWERAAQAAYGPDWRAVWRSKHGGSTEGCSLAHKFGMPLEACYQAAASEGDVASLESRLMKCPSWENPSGAMFDPHDPDACRARARYLASAQNEQAGDNSSSGADAQTASANADTVH